MSRRTPTPKYVAIIAVAIGLTLHAFAAAIDSSAQAASLTVALMVWGWMPYLIAVLLIFTMQRSLIPLCGVALPLLVDFLNAYALFVTPSSTAALNQFWIPLWNLLVVEPLGLLLGWLTVRLRLRSD